MTVSRMDLVDMGSPELLANEYQPLMMMRASNRLPELCHAVVVVSRTRQWIDHVTVASQALRPGRSEETGHVTVSG